MLTQTLPTILPFLLLLHQLPQLLFQLLFQLVWILRGFIGDSFVPLTYAYILLESKHAECYDLALSTIKAAAPLFNPPNFMVDFETSEHSAIRSNYPNSTIHGCLFHLKQAFIRHFKAALPAYGANALLRSDFCSFFGLAFVPVADTETCWRLLKNYLLAAYPFAYSTLVIDYLESTWLYILHLLSP